jgi:hypothetical protein
MGLHSVLGIGSAMAIAVKQNNWRQNRGSWGTILCLASSCSGALAGADTVLRARHQPGCGGKA